MRSMNESSDCHRIEDRLSGADADPELATLITTCGIYWALAHGKQPPPLDDSIATRNTIPNNKDEYGVFLQAFEKSDVARNLLGDDLYQELTKLRREQYQEIPREEPGKTTEKLQSHGQGLSQHGQGFDDVFGSFMGNEESFTR